MLPYLTCQSKGITKKQNQNGEKKRYKTSYVTHYKYTTGYNTH